MFVKIKHIILQVFCNNTELMKREETQIEFHATVFRREFHRKVHNFRKCAGLLVAQITSLTEGYLLLSEDPVQGGKMEWSQEEEGKGRIVGKERPRTTWCRTLARRHDALLSSRRQSATRRSKWQIDVRRDRTIYFSCQRIKGSWQNSAATADLTITILLFLHNQSIIMILLKINTLL